MNAKAGLLSALGALSIVIWVLILLDEIWNILGRLFNATLAWRSFGYAFYFYIVPTAALISLVLTVLVLSHAFRAQRKHRLTRAKKTTAFIWTTAFVLMLCVVVLAFV